MLCLPTQSSLMTGLTPSSFVMRKAIAPSTSSRIGMLFFRCPAYFMPILARQPPPTTTTRSIYPCLDVGRRSDDGVDRRRAKSLDIVAGGVHAAAHLADRFRKASASPVVPVTDRVLRAAQEKIDLFRLRRPLS